MSAAPPTPPKKLNCFTDVIKLWPSYSLMAKDIGVAKKQNIGYWARVDSIPAEYWSAIVEASRRRHLWSVTIKLLAKFAARKHAYRRRMARNRSRKDNSNVGTIPQE